MSNIVRETLKRDGTLQSKQGYTISRSFIVVTGSPLSESEVINLTGIPRLGDRFSSGSLYCVSTIKATQTGQDACTWDVNVSYIRTEYEGEDEAVDPTDEAAKIRFGNELVEEVVRKCYGRALMGEAYKEVGADETLPPYPVLNSHNDEFDPPVMGRRYNAVISITRNEHLTAIQLADMQTYQGSINKVAVTVAGKKIAPYQGLLRDIGIERAYDSEGRRYWIVTYEIVVDPTRHSVKVLDQGFEYYKLGEGDLRFKEPDSDEASTAPGKLNGRGGKAGTTDVMNASFTDVPPVASDPPVPVYLEFLTIFPRDWTRLKLPDSPSDKYS